MAWVEWAFGQKHMTRQDSGLSALHEIIESAQIQSVEPIHDDPDDDAKTVHGRLPAISAAELERRRESLASMPVGEAMLRRRRGGQLWPWLVVAMLALVALLALKLFG